MLFRSLIGTSRLAATAPPTCTFVPNSFQSDIIVEFETNVQVGGAVAARRLVPMSDAFAFLELMSSRCASSVILEESGEDPRRAHVNPVVAINKTENRESFIMAETMQLLEEVDRRRI